MFEDKMGGRQGLLAPDPLTRKGVELWLERVLGYYGEDGGVDVQIIDGQLLLVEETADYIYSQFTTTEIHYRKGSRPMLEHHLAEHLPEGLSERDKALAVMRLVRDNRDFGLKGTVEFDGGTEEELIKRGATTCNELARLFCCLCQIAGLPARYVGHHISGHATVEVLVEGRWWWMDPQKGIYATDENNQPLSTWQIIQDPTVFERQSLQMWRGCRPLGPFSHDPNDQLQLAFYMAKCRDCYFHPKEAICIGNYYIWEHERFTYPWRNRPDDPERLRRARREEMLNRKALGWPEYYFNHLLFNEPLKYRP